MQQEMINFEYAGAEFPLTANTFWTLFTEPSLQVMLHYSVNSYIDTPVIIKSPLAVAALKHEAEKGA
jgi:hypothetical protein